MLSAHGCLWLYLNLLILSASAGSEPGSGVKVVVSEGSDAILPCSLSTKESIVQKLFDWRKEGTVPPKDVFLYDGGLHYNNGVPGQDKQFKGRVSHFPEELQFGNASIIIRNTKLADSGDYTCDFPHLQPQQTFYIKLVVGVKVVVSEGSDAILPCSLSTKESIVQKLFDWRKEGTVPPKEVFMYNDGLHYNNGDPGQDEYFKGRVSHFPEELQFGNASIIIRNTKLADSGDYTCHFPHLQPQQRFYIKLVVDPVFKDRSGETAGVAPKLDITIVGVTDSGVQLKCVIENASPQPTLQWEDSDGDILPAEEPEVSERGGRYNVTLCSTVTPTKTNCFHCVVKQEGSYQVIDQKINLSESLFKERRRTVTFEWLVAGIFLGASILAIVEALLVATKKLTIHFGNGCQRKMKMDILKDPPEDGE